MTLSLVGVLLAVGALVLVGGSVLGTDLRWREVSFVVGPQEVQLTFEVYGEEGDMVRCQVRASDERFADVGQIDVDLGPLPARGLSRTVTVRTVAPATSASVRTCVLAPDRLL